MVASRPLLATTFALAFLGGCTGILGSFDVGPGAGDAGGGGIEGGSTDGGTDGPVPPSPFSITVVKNGNGKGTVTSAPAALDCGTICAAAYPAGTSVTLTATPEAPSLFGGWGGACSGTAPCTVTVDKVVAVTATFSLPKQTVKVSKSGTGSGTVKSTPLGIDCGLGCEGQFDQGSNVKLVATPAAGSAFAGWKQGCTGDKDCNLTIGNAATLVEAEFTTFATWDPNWSTPDTITYANGNLSIASNSATRKNARTTVGRSTGAYYWELKANSGSAANNHGGIGLAESVMPPTAAYMGSEPSGFSFGYGAANTTFYIMWAGASFAGSPPAGTAIASGNVYMFALDATGGFLWCGMNGTWFNGGAPAVGGAAGTNPTVSGLTGTMYPGVSLYESSTNSFTANFGQAAFVHTVPAGFSPGFY